MEDLKPCPFCGSEAEIFVDKDLGVCVMCTNYDCMCKTRCGYDSLSFAGKWPDTTATDYSIKRWNRRVSDAKRSDQVCKETNEMTQ